jgi:hypothetical protein
MNDPSATRNSLRDSYVLTSKRLYQALRRSIKGEKERPPHIAIAPKSAIAIVPPKKVCPS